MGCKEVPADIDSDLRLMARLVALPEPHRMAALNWLVARTVWEGRCALAVGNGLQGLATSSVPKRGSAEENPMADHVERTAPAKRISVEAYVCHQCGEATLIEVGSTWACLNCGKVL